MSRSNSRSFFVSPLLEDARHLRLVEGPQFLEAGRGEASALLGPALIDLAYESITPERSKVGQLVPGLLDIILNAQ